MQDNAPDSQSVQNRSVNRSLHRIGLSDAGAATILAATHREPSRMEDIEAWRRPYLTGKCFDFALALAEKVDGATFVAVGDPAFPDHVGLRLPDGRYADVRGLLDESAFLAHHTGPITTVGREVLELHSGLSGVEPPYPGNRDIAIARDAVRMAFPTGIDLVELHETWENDRASLSAATSNDIATYCHGECHVFAVALHRLTGWPIHVVVDNDEHHWDSEEDDDDFLPVVVHVLCEDPDGNLWDVRGSRPRDSLYEEMMGWTAIMDYDSSTGLSEDELRAYVGFWGDPDPIDRPLTSYTEDDVALATATAHRVLAELPGFPSLEPAPAP